MDAGLVKTCDSWMSCVSFPCTPPKCHKWCKGPSHSGLHYRRGTLRLNHYYSKWKQDCFSGEETLDLKDAHTTLRNGPGKGQSELSSWLTNKSLPGYSGSITYCLTIHSLAWHILSQLEFLHDCSSLSHTDSSNRLWFPTFKDIILKTESSRWS